MAVTRCQENTGFLVLHRCENPAEFDCVYCGRRVCHEHGRPVEAPVVPATPPPAVPDAGGAMAPPPPPAAAAQAYACLTCLRNRQQQPQKQQGVGPGYNDPYYQYPYYGSYRPYHSGYYYDYGDRGVFDRDRSSSSDNANALGS